jgi:hypothetical protein
MCADLNATILKETTHNTHTLHDVGFPSILNYSILYNLFYLSDLQASILQMHTHHVVRYEVRGML